MNRVTYGLAVLLLSLAVTPLSAQRGQRRQFRQAPPSPVQMVLDGADELFLSDEQIERIAEIVAELDEKNACPSANKTETGWAETRSRSTTSMLISSVTPHPGGRPRSTKFRAQPKMVSAEALLAANWVGGPKALNGLVPTMLTSGTLTMLVGKGVFTTLTFTPAGGPAP